MKLSNATMASYIESLSSILDRNDIIGYAAARNYRILHNACAEYLQRRQDIFNKYAIDELDDTGTLTGQKIIPFDSDNFKQFKCDIVLIETLEHEVSLYKIPYDAVCGKLTGSEILEIDWMLEDSDSPIEE